MDNIHNLQEIIINTIKDITVDYVDKTSFLTLIAGKITHKDEFNNFYNFEYEKETYTGFSITGGEYKVDDMVYILKLNNEPTTKHMILSGINDYSNFDLKLALNDTIEDINNSLLDLEQKNKELSIIGNTIFTLNDDLTITPEILTFAAKKSVTITDVNWFLDGILQPKDDLKKAVIPNTYMANRDSATLRVVDSNDANVYDEITIVRVMKSDTKLDLDLGLDSVLLQKEPNGVIHYDNAILEPKVFDGDKDITADGWDISYKIEIGSITITKEENKYKITEMISNQSKLTFFARKNGNLYLQRTIYIITVSKGGYYLDIRLNNTSFIIPTDSKGAALPHKVMLNIMATRGIDKVRLTRDEIPLLEGLIPTVEEKEDLSLEYTWDIPEGHTLNNKTNGFVDVKFIAENNLETRTFLWNKVENGAPAINYILETVPNKITLNKDKVYVPETFVINSIMQEGGDISKDFPCIFKIYETYDNVAYVLKYTSSKKESSVNYTLLKTGVKNLKVIINNGEIDLTNKYIDITLDADEVQDNVDVITKKTEEHDTEFIKTNNSLKLLASETESLTTITKQIQEVELVEINRKYAELNVTTDGILQRVTATEEDITSIDGVITEQSKRLASAESKLTAEQWSLWFTETINNSTATSTKFTMDRNGLHIKGGGIDILNNAGAKVLQADSSGNLIINNLKANNGAFSGTISGSTIAGSTINGGTITGDTTINVGTDLYVGNNIFLGPMGSNYGKRIIGSKVNFIDMRNDYTYMNGFNFHWGDFGMYETGVVTTNAPRMTYMSSSGGSYFRNGLGLFSVQFGGINNIGETGPIYSFVLDHDGEARLECRTFVVNGSIVTGSDKKLKENIEDIDLTPLLDCFSLKKFDYRNGNKNSYGVIANEFEKSKLYHAVLKRSSFKVGVKKNGKDKLKKYYSFNYQNLFLAATQEVCNLRERVNNLENRILKLENHLKKEGKTDE